MCYRLIKLRAEKEDRRKIVVITSKTMKIEPHFEYVSLGQCYVTRHGTKSAQRKFVIRFVAPILLLGLLRVAPTTAHRFHRMCCT